MPRLQHAVFQLFCKKTLSQRLRSLFTCTVLPLLLATTATAQTFTWIGAGANDLFNNAANWQGGNVPGTSNPARNNLLIFGAESGSNPNYVNILNQANNQDQQRVGQFTFTSDAGAYTMNRSAAQEYTLFGLSAGTSDPGVLILLSIKAQTG